MSFLPIDASFSAGQYAELAHAEIDDALAEDRRPIVVGGTGLYLRAALTKLAEQSFIDGLNDILLVAAIVAFVGAILAAVLTRPSDFVQHGT